MLNIQKMIEKAIAATGAPVALLIEPSDTGFSAALVWIVASGDTNSMLGETITLESDWKVELAAEGATVELAVAALDVICSEDFR